MPSWLGNARRVAASAGASTPASQVKSALERLRAMEFREVFEAEAIEEDVHSPLALESSDAQQLTHIAANE